MSADEQPDARNGHDFDGGQQCVRCNCGIAVAHLMPCNRPAAGVDGSIHRLRRAVAAFYGSDESEPAPAELEARELELDAALRAWLQAGMPGGGA